MLADSTQPAAMRNKSSSADHIDKPLSQALSDARADAATEAAPMSPGASYTLALMSDPQLGTPSPQQLCPTHVRASLTKSHSCPWTRVSLPKVRLANFGQP